jgi:hypothetical protein
MFNKSLYFNDIVLDCTYNSHIISMALSWELMALSWTGFHERAKINVFLNSMYTKPQEQFIMFLYQFPFPRVPLMFC